MANVRVELTGDEAKLLRSLDKIVQKERELARAAADTGKNAAQAGRMAEKANQGAFGTTALKQIGSYITGMVSVTAAVAGVTGAIRALKSEADEAGKRIVDSISGRRQLLQIASTTREFERLVATVDKLRAGGIPDVQAFQTVFAAGSAGPQFLKDIGQFAQLRQIGISPEAGIESAQKFQAAFGGTDPQRGAGSARQIINKVLAAAGPSPVQAEAIARASSSATERFAAIGGTDEELLAIGAILSETFKTPEAAFERVKSLSEQLAKKRKDIRIRPGEDLPGGLGLIRALPGLAERGRLRSPTGKRLRLEEFISEGNAAAALGQIQKDEARIAERQAEILEAEVGTGTTRDLFAGRVAIGARDLVTGAVTGTERAQGRERVEVEKTAGTIDLLIDRAITERSNAIRAKGGDFPAFLSRVAARATRFLTPDEFFLETFPRRNLSPDLQNRIDLFQESSSKMADAASDLQAQNAALSPVSPNEPNTEDR